jgi:hypothetical protein
MSSFSNLTTVPEMTNLRPTIPAWPLNNAQIGGLLIFGRHMGFPADWQNRPIWQIKEATA